jgi:2-phospho-L-lactate guanylyltransferase
MELLVERAVREVRSAPSVDRVILVSSDPEASPLAGRWNVELFDDRGLPWNDAIAAAMAEAAEPPSVLILSADLPLVTAGDVQEFVRRAPSPGVAIARARDAGTNAVVMSPPNGAATCFGVPGSAAEHAALARAAGLPAEIVDLPHLAFDLDSLSDLELVLERPDVPPELRAVLSDGG